MWCGFLLETDAERKIWEIVEPGGENGWIWDVVMIPGGACYCNRGR